MTTPKTYTRTITCKAWQWNGLEDNRDLDIMAGGWVGSCFKCEAPTEKHSRLWQSEDRADLLCPGDWIIHHADDTYEVLSDAEFEAQGWKEEER